MRKPFERRPLPFSDPIHLYARQKQLRIHGKTTVINRIDAQEGRHSENTQREEGQPRRRPSVSRPSPSLSLSGTDLAQEPRRR